MVGEMLGSEVVGRRGGRVRGGRRDGRRGGAAPSWWPCGHCYFGIRVKALSISAHRASVRLLALVNPLVRRNGALLAEPPGAHRATIWLVAGVGPLVRRNLALLAEPPKNMGHRDPGGKSIEQDYGFSPAACVRPVVKMPRGQGRGNVGLTFSDSGGGGLPQPTLCPQFRPRRVRLDRHSLTLASPAVFFVFFLPYVE